ncbi:hypothetical protein PG997_011193 [Apiospora hydei]|uniref:Uncharacterized protein n=1 Tax=Apiospora hydei TaxID=1337664 RepID=A0ABR1VIC4_9PEZI
MGFNIKHKTVLWESAARQPIRCQKTKRKIENGQYWFGTFWEDGLLSVGASHISQPTSHSNLQPTPELQVQGRPDGTVPFKFAPTAAEFVVRPATIDGAVLDATFVTRSLPDVDDKTCVIALLAVPYNKAGPEKEGWHISDFLAIKTMVSPLANPRAQVWLSLCDTDAVVKQDPTAYTHGSEHRVVSGAASTVSNDTQKIGTVDGQVPVVFEPDVEKIKSRFFDELGKKSYAAAELGFPVLLVISGRTTLEQDVYLDGYDVVITSEQIRDALDTRAQVTVVTSSLTSAGWQINPFFHEGKASLVTKKPIDFLARQCGAIFSRTIVDQFLGWQSPFLDNDKVNPSKKALEAHPGPAMPNTEQLKARGDFSNETHALLASRLFPDHYEHSFLFDAEKDPWTHLIGERKIKNMLETYSKIWKQLDIMPPASPDNKDRLTFLGTAFGGHRLSQISHLKHLVQESFPSWPGYYTSTFGQNVRAEFGKFLRDPNPSDIDCHVIFSIVEYRMTSMILGDLLIKYAGLDLIWAQRCRDWDEQRYDGMVQKEEVSLVESATAARVMGTINRSFPFFYIPPGRELDSSKLHHQRPPRISRYLAIGLTLRYRDLGPDLDAAVTRVLKMIQQLKDKQVQLLLDDEDLRKKAEAWWKSIEQDVIGDVSMPEPELAANFVPSPPELSTPNPEVRVVQDARADIAAEHNLSSDIGQDATVAEIEVQSPEQPATPNGHGEMGQDASPMFKIEQGASPEIKIESPVFKTDTPDIIDIEKAAQTLPNADEGLLPHLRKVWKPKSPRLGEVKPAVVEEKPAVVEENNDREALEEEVTVHHFTIPKDSVMEKAQHDSVTLDVAKPDFIHDEASKLESPAATKVDVPRVDKSLPPHLRGKDNPVTAPYYH